jgi:tetratricopeptide (TPR) repeat protein
VQSTERKQRVHKQHHQTGRKSSNRDEICKLFQQAKVLEKKGQWIEAVQLLERILQIDPADAHSHLALARLQARRGRDARDAFEMGTRACPNSVHLWQAWAVYEDTVRGNTFKAVQLFDQALQLDPANPYVCHAYGLMALKTLGRADQAKELWERALGQSSTAALVCSLGELLIADQKYVSARDLYTSNVIRLKSEREKTEVYLALAWLEERYFSNFDRAEQLIESAVASSPRSSVAQIAWARLEGRRQQRFQGRHHQGKDVRDATVRRLATACLNIERGTSEKQPVDGRIYNAWANLEVKARRFRDARKILYRGLARYPRDHSLLQAAGKVEERLGNYTGAIDLYSASLSIQPSAPTLVAYALLNLQQRLQANDAGQLPSPVTTYNDTRRLFEEALLVDKRHGPAYNAYGRFVFEHLHNEDEARNIFERGLRVNCTDSASIYHGYARLELALGNVNRARELLVEGNRAVRRMNVGTDSPHRDRALFLTHTLGMLELNANRPAVSLEVFNDGIERYGNSSQLLLGAALSEVKLGNEPMARELFERSVLSDERHAHAWQAWGVMEMKAGNLKMAKTLFECGIRSAPKHGALWHAYGILEQRVGNIETARALFKKGIEVCPDRVTLYHSWASLELRECNYNAAKALVAQGLTLDKRHGSGWIISAEIEEKLGNHGIASLLLRRGIECSPTNAQLYRALGDALVRQGKILEAREIFERGIEVDPTHAPLYHALAELEARVCNIEGLANLNKRAASIFNTNALEPTQSSSEAWGSKIRAGRSRALPKVVAALAQRIVEDDGENVPSFVAEPAQLLDGLLSPSLLEEGLVITDLLDLDAESSTPR